MDSLHKKNDLLISIMCLCILLPLFCISVYNRPCADDYDYSLITHHIVKDGGSLSALIGGAVKTSAKFYLTWQGLYTSAFLLSLQPAIWGEQYYAFAALIVMGSIFAFIFGSVYILNRRSIRKTFSFTLCASLCVFVFFILWMPSPLEGIFWFNGAMNYSPWAFANVFNLCLLLEIAHQLPQRRGRVLLLLSCILAFLTSGANHVTAFANILFLLTASVWGVIKKRLFAILPFAAACVGFVIMYLAPGTAIRQSYFIQPSAVYTVHQAFLCAIAIIHNWVSIPWVLSIMLLTPFILDVIRRKRLTIPVYVLPVLFVFSFGMICAMLCVPYYAMGSFGAMRVGNVIWFTFVLLSWINYGVFLTWISSGSRIRAYMFRKGCDNSLAAVFVKVICLILLVFVSGNGQKSSTYYAMEELMSGRAQQYCREMDERFAAYHDETLSEVVVEPIRFKSRLLFLGDLKTDPDIWPNTSIGTYYGKSIRVQDGNTDLK